MKERVKYKETILGSAERIPIIKKFLTFYDENSNNFIPYWGISSDKMNDFIGFDFVEKKSLLTSDSMNAFLDECEKRGLI